MELVLSLVLLQLTLAMVASKLLHYGATAVAGLCVLASFQLLALWIFRRQCPEGVLRSVALVSPVGNILRWTVVCIACVTAVSVIDANYFSPQAGRVIVVKLVASHWYGWLAGVFIMPVVEELVFRAILIEIFIKKFRWSVAVTLAAVIFGLSHGDTAQAVVVTIFGIIFGTAYVRTKSLLPSLIGHVLLNAQAFWRLSSVTVS